MTAAYTGKVSTAGGVLNLAFELGWTHWNLAFTIGHGQKHRQRTIRARDLAALEQEIAKAKNVSSLPRPRRWSVATKQAVTASGCTATSRRAALPMSSSIRRVLR